MNQLGDPKGALAPLNAYLKRGGPIAVEARAARIEALRRLNRTGDEMAAIDGLDRGEQGRVGPHPDTFAAIPEKDER